MDDLIIKLTDNFKYATDIVLFLTINDDITSMNYLDYLNIKGKELEKFQETLPELSPQFIKETIRFLRSGFISEKDIHDNLNNITPICFVPRLLVKGEDWDNAYEDFAGDFYSKFPRPKSR